MQSMYAKDFDESLSQLKGKIAAVSNSGRYPEPGAASVELTFNDGSRLRSDYWRIIKRGKADLSSFDHNQKYGLPAKIDAFLELDLELQDRKVIGARWDCRTGDLIFEFEGEIEFQALNFTGYEVWEIHFSNGSGEYSPYAK
jgi:hypothetical protein